MEGMVVSAVFTLQDVLSGGLARIRSLLGATDASTASLSVRMGKLALAMAPVAVLCGTLAFGLGLATSKAIAFESSMADVGKVVDFETRADFDAMGESILHMSGRIPMAADGIAAIVASAAQSGVARDDLIEFAEQAAKMGVAFDLSGDQAGKMMADWRAGMGLSLPRVYSLADAVNHLSNNMNATAPALGEVIQRTGALAMACGLGETQVAALGAAFLSAGASPEIASTALKKFTATLVKGEAMARRSQEAFTSLGLSVTQMAKDMQTDAQGTIFKVLQALADKPKELQISLLTQMFGEEAIGAIAPLLTNMGNLTQAFELTADAAQFAGSMQGEFDTRSKTVANTLQLLSNKFTALCVTVGNVFLPYVNSAAEMLGDVLDMLRGLFATPVGQWFLRAGAGLATAVIAVTAFSGAIWAVGAVTPLVSKALAAMQAALYGLGTPVLFVIAVISALVVAYKTNFGGFADFVDNACRKVSLVVRGVVAVFKTLTGGVGEIRGELAEDIEAAGLVGVVTTLSRLIRRFMWIWQGVWDEVTFHFSGVRDKLGGIYSRLIAVFERFGNAFGRIFDRLFGGSASAALSSGVSSWHKAGVLIGGAFNFILDVAVFSLDMLVSGIELVTDAISYLCALFTGDFQTAGELAHSMAQTIAHIFSSWLDLLPFGMGDAIRGILTEVLDVISNFNLFESGKKLLGTLADGVVAAKDELVGKVSEVFSSVREYLPFSDAKKGPFSELTASGAAIVGTLAQGVAHDASGLVNSVAGVFSRASAVMGFEALPPLPGLEAMLGGFMPAYATAGEAPPPATAEGRSLHRQRQGGERGMVIQNLNVTLPDVKDGQGFADTLRAFLERFDANEESV